MKNIAQNRLHTNPNCKVAQDGINNAYDTIIIYTTLNRTYNVDVSRKKSQKNAYACIEDSVRYRAE